MAHFLPLARKSGGYQPRHALRVRSLAKVSLCVLLACVAIAHAGCSSEQAPSSTTAAAPARPPSPVPSAVPPAVPSAAPAAAPSAVPSAVPAAAPNPSAPSAELAGAPIEVPKGTEVLYASAPSPFVAVGHNQDGTGTCEVWDLQKLQRTGTLQGKLDPSDRFALSRDGRHFAFTVGKKTASVVAVWSIQTGRELKRIEVNPTPIEIEVLEFAGPGQLVTAKPKDNGRLFQVWDIASGKPAREFAGPPKFEKDSATVSPDGKYLAVFHDKNALVYDLATGAQTHQLAAPQPPFSIIFCRCMRFAADGTELAGVLFNNRDTEIVSWSLADNKLVVHHPIVGDVKMWIPGASSYKGAAFDWLPDSSAFLLYGHAIVDRATGRLVWMIRSAERDDSDGPRRILDNDRVVVVSSGSGTRRLEIVTLPWKQIDAALKAMAGDAPAHIKPGQAVSLQIEVGAVRSGTPDQTKAELVKALTERLEKDGVKVADGQPAVLAVRYSEEAGGTMQEIAGGGPGKRGPGPFGGVATGKSVQATKAKCEVTYTIAGVAAPIWAGRCDADPHHLIIRGGATEEKLREATFGMLKTKLTQQPFPYFVPKDPGIAALPGTTQFGDDSAGSAKPAGKATPKPTRRGGQ